MEIDFETHAFVEDPYPVLERVRSRGPVVRHATSGQLLLTGWRDCARVLGDAETYATDPTMFLSLFGDHTMETMDKDRHDAVRGIWAPAFQRASLAEQRELVVEVVDSQLGPLVERLRAGERVDAVSGLTRRVPTMVIARLMGIPVADHEQFAAWSDAMGDIVQGLQDPSPEGERLVLAGREATAELNQYVRDRIAERSEPGGDDLVSRMVDSPVARDLMTEGEVVASNTQLVFAGNETTAKLMSVVLLALARFPDVRRALRADRSLLPQAVEEIHRWNSVSTVTWRTVRGEDAEVAGHHVPAGSVLMLLRNAANRDPDRWEHPDVVDLRRPPRGHLGFGFGMHSCLGLNLARLEVQVLLDRLLDELPDWEVTDVDWGVGWALRGPTRLGLTAA
jgi:cytochrome P450